MREYTNLGWPQTPFGADKRPFPRKVHLVAATAVHWADDGRSAVPVAAGLVYLPVRRVGTLSPSPDTLHAGYRVAVLEGISESAAVVDLIDGHMVQARRHAAAVAVHCWLDNFAALRTHAAGDTPGITSVAAARKDRNAVERGTARIIDTSVDIQDGSISLPLSCERHGLTITEGTGGLMGIAEIQAAYEQLFTVPATQSDLNTRDCTIQDLGLSALYQGLVTALLAAETIGCYIWDRPFWVSKAFANLAWDAFPHVLSDLPATGAGKG